MRINTFQFLTTDIWRLRLRELPPVNAFFIRQLRIIVLTISGFIQDKCQLRAASLVYYSILSIGPIIALAFGIAKGFDMEEMLQERIINRIPAQEEILTQITEYAKALLQNTKGEVIAGVGIVLLIWAVVKVLSHIETSVSEIWHIERTRTWRRKLAITFHLLSSHPFYW